MNANVSKLLNEQINKEFYSAYLYLDFANYYAAVGLDGFENWYRVQAQEERDHAMLFYQYLQNNGEAHLYFFRSTSRKDLSDLQFSSVFSKVNFILYHKISICKQKYL